jgi:hypothetical protein
MLNAVASKSARQFVKWIPNQHGGISPLSGRVGWATYLVWNGTCFWIFSFFGSTARVLYTASATFGHRAGTRVADGSMANRSSLAAAEAGAGEWCTQRLGRRIGR